MSEGRKKKPNSPSGNDSIPLPLGDPFERILTTPKEALIHRTGSPRHGTASPVRSKGFKEVCLEQLPRLNEVSNPQIREKLLESKLEQCLLICPFEAVNLDSGSAYSSTDVMGGSSAFNSPNAPSNFISPLDLRNQEIKRQCLVELIELISCGHRPIPDALYPNFFKMIFKNLFRPIPPPFNPTGDAFDPAEDEPVLEPSWPHLQLIYEIFIRFLESPDLNSSLARKFIDSFFIVQLLALFDVEDPRERDLLKTTLHRIYAKFLQLRSFIRKSIHNIFYEFVADPTEYRHNISEMLEILGSIINGFALPLKDEHKLFLEKTLLPLHKTRYLSLYFRQLSYCIVQFIEKDPSLSIPVIRGLLRIWPKTNTTKEVMFLSEIEEILDIMPVEYFGPICEALFKQLALCIDSNHFQVAERALMFWHIEYITDTLIGSSKENLERILKIILPVLSKHSKSHWNRNVQLLILNALECFMSIDPVIFDACVAQLPQLQEEALQRRKRLYHCWNELDSIESRRRTVDSEFDKARQDLYKLLLIDDDASSGGGSDRENSRNTNNSSISTSTSQTNTTKAASSSQIVNTRRKSVLPVDTNVYQELLNYSRSSSPRPSDEEIDSSSSSTTEANDNNMKD